MENWEQIGANRNTELAVDAMFTESDRVVCEILQRIAALGINAMSSSGRTPDSESGNVGSNPADAAK